MHIHSRGRAQWLHDVRAPAVRSYIAQGPAPSSSGAIQSSLLQHTASSSPSASPLSSCSNSSRYILIRKVSSSTLSSVIMPRPIHAVDPELDMLFDGSATYGPGVVWIDQPDIRTSSPDVDIRSAGRPTSWTEAHQDFMDVTHAATRVRHQSPSDNDTSTASRAIAPNSHDIFQDSQTLGVWDDRVWPPSPGGENGQLIHSLAPADTSGGAEADVGHGSFVLPHHPSPADSSSWTMVDASHCPFVLTPLSSPAVSVHLPESPYQSHSTPTAASAALLALSITEAADGMAEDRCAEAGRGGNMPYAAFGSTLASRGTPHLVTSATPELTGEWVLPMSPMSAGSGTLTPDDEAMEGSRIDEASLLGYRAGRFGRGLVGSMSLASVAATTSSSRGARSPRKRKRATGSGPFEYEIAPTGRHKCSKCPKRFNRKEHCKRHEFTHLPPGQKQLFKCDKCESTLTRTDNLKEHRKKHYIKGGKVPYIEDHDEP